MRSAADTRPPVPPLGVGQSVRILVAGALMGLANLVPGISGGTMVLVMGLYDRFVEAMANLTRLRIRFSDVVFVMLLGTAAGLIVLSLAGWIRNMYASHRMAMLALFIGLTLGGAPLLVRLSRPLKFHTVILIGLGIGLIAAFSGERPERAVSASPLAVDAHYGIDFAGGILGAASMVLPGISGSYMLLLIDRYDAILGAIDALKDRDLAALHVLVPVGLGAGLGLMFISNILKWCLRHQARATHAILLGILLGSIIGLWPFDDSTTGPDYLVAVGLAAGGFVITFLLARLSPPEDPTPVS